jgi:protein-tyrosine phosphatase
MAAILIVCTGNVCRSPIAEGMIRHALEARLGERAPMVASVGTSGWDGSGATPEAVAVAAERGIDISAHAARRLQPGHVRAADVVLAMASEHRDEIGRSAPEARDRIFTLKELVRLLEALPPPDRDGALPERIRAAATLRGSGREGKPLDEDIADPIGLPIEGYRAIAWELHEWCGRLVDGLVGTSSAARTVGA